MGTTTVVMELMNSFVVRMIVHYPQCVRMPHNSGPSLYLYSKQVATYVGPKGEFRCYVLTVQDIVMRSCSSCILLTIQISVKMMSFCAQVEGVYLRSWFVMVTMTVETVVMSWHAVSSRVCNQSSLSTLLAISFHRW